MVDYLKDPHRKLKTVMPITASSLSVAVSDIKNSAKKHIATINFRVESSHSHHSSFFIYCTYTKDCGAQEMPYSPKLLGILNFLTLDSLYAKALSFPA